MKRAWENKDLNWKQTLGKLGKNVVLHISSSSEE